MTVVIQVILDVMVGMLLAIEVILMVGMMVVNVTEFVEVGEGGVMTHVGRAKGGGDPKGDRSTRLIY
jgi:hypothetical protein